MGRTIFAISSLLFCAIWGCGRSSVNPLPVISDVDSIAISYGQGPQIVLSKSAWNDLYEALLPATADNNPAKWEVLSNLTINKKDGSSLIVNLYQTSEDAGAFAITEADGNRQYYRGGDSEELKKILLTARTVSK